MPRRFLGVVLALVASVAPGAPVAASARPEAAPGPASPPPAAPVLVIEGKGFGHGVGMAQDGAIAMAASGASAAAILGRFYPGTSIARRSATVRVAVLDAPGPVVLALPGGGEVRDAPSGAQSPGFPIVVNPGGSVSLSLEGGRYKATPLGGAALTRTGPPPASSAPPPAAPGPPPAPVPGTPPATPPTTSLLDPLLQTLLPTTVPPTTGPAAPAGGPGVAGAVPANQNFAFTARALWTVPKGDSVVSVAQSGRSYRGTIVTGAGGRGLQLTDEVDVEQYVRGMGEMPASAPPAALQAQAVAARTFATRAAAAGRTLCDDQQCQVYIGAGNESGPTSAAAVATKGQVLTYGGGLAETVYSASAGGISATPEEGFGPGSPALPYLTPVEYPVGDPQLWAASIPLSQVGGRFGYAGEVADVRVTRTGPSGRPLDITFDGASGPMVVDGHRFWAQLELRSTLFTLRTESAELPAAGAQPLAALVPRLPGVSGDRPNRVASRPLIGVPSATLGRAPWVGLAVLLLAGWANAAHRATGRRPAAVGAVVDVADGDDGPVDGEEQGGTSAQSFTT